jgi:hypothetical protein
MENRPLRVRRRDDPSPENDPAQHTPAERLQMVWPLTRQAWAFKQAASSDKQDRAQSRLQRHTVRLRRRGG